MAQRVLAQRHLDRRAGRIGQQALARRILEDPAVLSLSSFIGVDGTNATLKGDKRTYQMDPANADEALREVDTIDDVEVARALLKRADDALYRAKREGRDRTVSS